MIYFVQSGPDGYIKIGTAKCVDQRLSGAGTMNPYEIKLLAKMDGGEEKETELHQKFKHSHVRGEWFKPSQDLLDYIADVKKSGELLERNVKVHSLCDVKPSAACSPSCRATIGALVSALRGAQMEASETARNRIRAAKGAHVLLRQLKTIYQKLFNDSFADDALVNPFKAYEKLIEISERPYSWWQEPDPLTWEDPIV